MSKRITHQEQPAIKDWTHPHEIDDLTLAFPAFVVGVLMPSMDQIPEEFHRFHGTAGVRFVGNWFYGGIRPEGAPAAKKGIDERAAYRHLGAVLGSYQPKHEHKIAAAGYLASLWLELKP